MTIRSRSAPARATRRELLVAAVAALAAALPLGTIAGPAAAYARPPAGQPAAAELRRQLLRLLDERIDAEAIGRRYLHSHPDARPAVHALARDLLRRSSQDEAALASWLRAAVHRDFVGNEIAVVDGWVLARTEARACALTVIL